MPGLITSSPVHCTRPLWLEPKKGYTTEFADGTETGAKATYNAHHFMHYRFGGPCHWSYIREAETTGTIYIMIDHPERRDGGNQEMYVMFHGMATADTGYTLEWRDAFGAGGYTTLYNPSSSSTDAEVIHFFSLSFVPPTSATNSQKVIEIKYTDLSPLNVSAFMYGKQYTPSSEFIMDPEANGVGSILATGDGSFGGLMAAIGDGADDVESIERMTRRTFFNGCHPDGSLLDGATYAATWKNMFTEHEFRTRPRILTSLGYYYCHPMLVIKSHGHTGRDESVKIKMTETVSSNAWEYELQAGDAEDTPLFINQWSTGSSSNSGLKLEGSNTVKIEGYCTANCTLHLLAWGLIEGSPFA